MPTAPFRSFTNSRGVRDERSDRPACDGGPNPSHSCGVRIDGSGIRLSGQAGSPRRWMRWRRPLAVVIAVVALAVVATLANVALLGSTGEERIGRLSPVASVATGGAVPVTPAPAVHESIEHLSGDHDDD